MHTKLADFAIDTFAVADPGFPVGGRGLHRGVWTPEAVTFQKLCMSKRKNWDPWGRAQGTPPRTANESSYLAPVQLNNN